MQGLILGNFHFVMVVLKGPILEYLQIWLAKSQPMELQIDVWVCVCIYVCISKTIIQGRVFG